MMGADVCTMRFETLQMMYDHPLTDSGIQQFLDDWSKVPGREEVMAK
jgi:transaldolase